MVGGQTLVSAITLPSGHVFVQTPAIAITLPFAHVFVHGPIVIGVGEPGSVFRIRLLPTGKPVASTIGMAPVPLMSIP